MTEAVHRRATVLASSRRLARELRAAHDHEQAVAGRESWPTPDILFWQDWLVRTLTDAARHDTPLLLHSTACTLLWEQSLRTTSPADLLSTSSVVRNARQAWQRLHEFQVPLGEVAAAAGNNDERWFSRAAHAYRDSLDAGNWIDMALLPSCIAGFIRRQEIELPAEIVHAGFDRIVPALQELFDALLAAGITVSAAPPVSHAAELSLARYADSDAERRAAGAWAHRVLAANPGASVAIVVPDLESGSERIARLVREGFAPGWQLGDETRRAAVQVSYGQRLADFPPVGIALLCLRWLHRGLSGADLSILLRTPFLGDDDLAGRSRLERHLRTLPDRPWGASELLRALGGARHEHNGVSWRTRMAAIGEMQAVATEPAAPPEWARRFDELLGTLGWPGITRLDSDEFQLVNRWRQLLNEFARMATVRPAMRLAEAVRGLWQIAAETVYQPESPSASVQLMGPLEAAGLSFDFLRIGGMDSDRWPPAGHPLSLVRRRLQRDYEMPDATPGDTLLFARRVLERLVTAAPSVSLTWPAAEGETVLAPSPLLADWPMLAAPPDDDHGWFAATLAGNVPLEMIPEDDGPPVISGEQIHGGAYIVQRQVENPFAAFAYGRLAVAELEPFASGLSARQRGTALHRALQELLNDRPTRGDLAAWPDSERGQRVERASVAALNRHRRHADAVLHRLLNIEDRRLQALLLKLLDQELTRADFAVAAVEQERTLTIGPVTLRLRIDRIDRLADGSLLLIDYKSGAVKSLLRQDGEPADLQLCVYARAINETVGGLLLLNIDSREIVYKGAGGSVPWGRIDPGDWPAILAAWCAQVDRTTASLAAGDHRLNLLLNRDKVRPLAVLSRVEEIRRAR
ncbi:MAG: PD-(D/E)XK nuclease family protein [Woeseiaceae bacterium]|nr:PD-(D/E)XK nuclease family protein [Woeseiaceae bacterium]